MGDPIPCSLAVTGPFDTKPHVFRDCILPNSSQKLLELFVSWPAVQSVQKKATNLMMCLTRMEHE